MRVRTMLLFHVTRKFVLSFPFRSVPFQVKVESSFTFSKAVEDEQKKSANHSPEFQFIFGDNKY